jgi:hypothetical protein
LGRARHGECVFDARVTAMQPGTLHEVLRQHGQDAHSTLAIGAEIRILANGHAPLERSLTLAARLAAARPD